MIYDILQAKVYVLILSETLALYKSFAYLLTYLLLWCLEFIEFVFLAGAPSQIPLGKLTTLLLIGIIPIVPSSLQISRMLLT